MKKYICMALTLALSVFVSCTDKEEIEIVQHHDLTLNINTQGLYDDFDITWDVRENFLRDESQCVGVITFVYDSNGDFITKEETHLPNFNATVQTFTNLVEGNYTFITVETLLNPDDNYESEVWSFDDSDKLSTLKITQKRYEPDENGYRWTIPAYAGSVLGVFTGNVSVNGNQTLDVKPNPIGSIIKFYPYNFDNSPFVTVGYTTQDILDYYSLDPSLSKENRYSKNLTASGKTNVRISMDVNADPDRFWGTYVLEPEMDWKTIVQTLDIQQKNHVLEWMGNHAKLEDGKTYLLGFYYLWDDGNSSYADCCFYDNESDLLRWKLECDDEVDRHNSDVLFTEPYTTWSVGTVTAVKTYMNGFYLFQDIEYQNDFGLYNMVYFDQANNNAQYMYFFTSSTRGLTDAIVYLKEEFFSLDKVCEEIAKQGYAYDKEENGMYLYINTSTRTGVSVQSYFGSIIVDYYSLEAYNAAPMHKTHNIEIPYINNVFSHSGNHISVSEDVVMSESFCSKMTAKIINR